MVYQPGDAILTGQVDGRQLGNAILQFLPALPHEGPPGMPRALAKRLFPQGFIRPAATMVEQPATLPVPTPEIIQAAKVVQPSIQPAQPVAVPQPAANQVVRTQVIPQPAPAGYRSASQGGEPVSARSQRIRIRERPGL